MTSLITKGTILIDFVIFEKISTIINTPILMSKITTDNYNVQHIHT